MTNELKNAIERVKRWHAVEDAREEMREALDRRQGTMFIAASVLFMVVCLVLQ